MSAIYLTEPGCMVRVSSRQIIVTKGKETVLQMPMIKVDRILVFGNIQITAQAVNVLLDEGIEVSYLSPHGKFRGKIQPAESKNVFLRIAQYERALDDDFSTEMARTIVNAKVNNGKALITRYQRNYPEQNFDKELESIVSTLSKLEAQRDVAGIMGIEGTATATFFKAYGNMFHGNLRFEKRTRRPPKDPVNAVLSFGYTLLTNEFFSLATAHGLDPYIGFLHGLSYGRPSLPLDLVEEFRHPFIDRFTLSLFNNQILTADDFEPVENQGIYLKKEALKRYFEHYERRVRESFTLTNSETRTTFRDLFKRQVNRMAQKIMKYDQLEYEPFKILE